MWNILYTAFDVVPYPKGASTHILQFIRGMVNAGHNVHLITPGDGTLPPQDFLEGASVTRISMDGGNNYLERALAFSEAVLHQLNNGSSYDLVHYRTHWGGLQLAQAKKQYGYRTLFEVNGLPSIELKYHYPALAGSELLYKIREQEVATLSLSDMVICPSAVTRAFIQSLGVPRGRVRVIPNGYSPRHYESLPQSPLNESGIPVILYVGTLADWQGLHILLDALPGVLTKHQVQLRIIGSGRSRQRKALLKKVTKMGLLDQVHLERAVPHHEIYDQISQANICVAPLGYNDRNVTQGCCPIKIIEYMGAAKPIVASNLPVVRELLREDVDGLLFTPDDTEDLARQVLRLLDDPSLAKRVSASAAERARTNFTWQAAQKKLLKVYTELMRSV